MVNTILLYVCCSNINVAAKLYSLFITLSSFRFLMIPQNKQEDLPGLHFPPFLQLHLSDPEEEDKTFIIYIIHIFLT